MRWLGLLSVAGGLLVLGACGKGITGEWEGKCETEDDDDNNYDYQVVLDLEEKGGDIEGDSDWETTAATNGGGEVDADMDGELQGEKDGKEYEIEGELDGDFGSVDVEFKLELDGGDLVGDVDMDYGGFKESGTCKLKKQK
jgi:hypothetical protein